MCMNFKENIDGTYEARFTAKELPTLVKVVALCEQNMREYKQTQAKDIEDAIVEAHTAVQTP